MKGLKKMMMAGGFARWVKNMVNVYSTNSTDVERVVVATSIIPFMRCAFDASAKAEKGNENVDLRFALCTATDLVSLTPAWPLAAAVTALARLNAALGWHRGISRLRPCRPERHVRE